MINSHGRNRLSLATLVALVASLSPAAVARPAARAEPSTPSPRQELPERQIGPRPADPRLPDGLSPRQRRRLTKAARRQAKAGQGTE